MSFNIEYMRSLWRTGDRGTVRAIALICVSVGIVGVSYGVTAGAAGFTLWQLLALAVLVLGASSEFLFVGIIAVGGSVVAAVVAGLLINSRNFAYGVAAGSFLAPGWRRAVGAHLVNDETVAVSTAQDVTSKRRAAFWLCGVGIALCWPMGAVLGSLLGGVVGDPAALGLDAAFPAAVLALVLPASKEKLTLVAAVVGSVVAVSVSPFLPAGAAPLVALIVAAVTIPFRSTVR